MKRILLILSIVLILVSCKQNYKNKIWRNGDLYFQLTDSLAYLDNGKNVAHHKDYFYELKNDSIFLNDGMCQIFSLQYKIEILKDSLILTGFQDHYNYWLFKNDSLNFIIDTLKFGLAKKQDDTLSRWNTTQKILFNSYDCQIQGSWFDSLTNSVLVFKNDICYFGEMIESSQSFLLKKGTYVCYNEHSFFIKNSCNGMRFMIIDKNDRIMNWYEEDFKDQSIRKNFIYRINDVKIDTSNYWLFFGRNYDIDSIDITPLYQE